jgi:hypothetical protein
MKDWYVKSNRSTILLVTLIGLYCLSFTPSSDWVGVSFMAITVQLMFYLHIAMRRQVSLVLVYYLFSLIFLTLLPWLHYSNDILLWRRIPLTSDIYFKVNGLLFLSHLLVFVLHMRSIRASIGTIGFSQKKQKIAPHVSLLLLTLSATGFITLLFLNEFSLQSLLFRGLDYEFRNKVVSSSALNLLLTMVSRTLPFFCLMYVLMRVEGSRWLKTILFIILLFSVFPTGVARYMVGMIYIPIALLFFPRLRSGGAFAILLVLAILFAFPFLDQFREFAGFNELQLLPSIDYFYAAHFDAYENFATAVENEFITYGWQLIGVLLFYVPRAIWPDKPIGSGQEMAEQLQYVFDNISMPFLGEGYVNFGVIGVIFFAIFIGYIITTIDHFFASSVRAFNRTSYVTAFYFYLIGSFFFILRGDLLSSFAYLCAGIFSAVVVAKLMSFVDSAQYKSQYGAPPLIRVRVK